MMGITPLPMKDGLPFSIDCFFYFPALNAKRVCGVVCAGLWFCQVRGLVNSVAVYGGQAS